MDLKQRIKKSLNFVVAREDVFGREINCFPKMGDCVTLAKARDFRGEKLYGRVIGLNLVWKQISILVPGGDIFSTEPQVPDIIENIWYKPFCVFSAGDRVEFVRDIGDIIKEGTMGVVVDGILKKENPLFYCAVDTGATKICGMTEWEIKKINND